MRGSCWKGCWRWAPYFLPLTIPPYLIFLFRLPIDDSNEAWVGAWWLGPLLSACLFLIVSIPMLGFPLHLPGYKKLEEHKRSEAYKGIEDKGPMSSGIKSVKEMPKSFLRLFLNPTFMFICLAGGVEGFLSHITRDTYSYNYE